MILNSSANLNAGNLFDVALHEAGLALGLIESTEAASVMYPVINQNATLAPGDIQNIQALYGNAAPDPNNNTIGTAVPISQPPLYLGATPLVAYGNLATISNTDFFSVQPPLLYTGPMTVQLQTSGISFMEPEVQVFNQNFKLVGQATSSSDLGDIVTVHLPSLKLLQRYYIEVSSPAPDVFGVGRYALSVTYDGLSLVNPASLPPILRGPYDSLSAGDIAGLLGGVGNVLFQNGLLDVNDTFLTAEPLSSEPGYAASSQYNVVASLGGGSAVDIYRIQAPTASSGQPAVLTVSLAQLASNGVLPVVSIYDANTNPVSSQILLNGNGSYVIQATGLTPGETYFLSVSAAPGARAIGWKLLTRGEFRHHARRSADVLGRRPIGIRPRGSVHPVHRRDPVVPVRAVQQHGHCTRQRTIERANLQQRRRHRVQLDRTPGRDRERRQRAIDPRTVPGERLNHQHRHRSGAVDHLSIERRQPFGPHRTGRGRSGRRTDVSLPGQRQRGLLLLPRRDNLHSSLRCLRHAVTRCRARVCHETTRFSFFRGGAGPENHLLFMYGLFNNVRVQLSIGWPDITLN